MATSLAIFLCMFAALTWRARAGLDPVLSANSSQQAAQPQKIIKRTVVVRRVIITELPAKASGSNGSGNVGAGSYTPPASSYSAPAQQYSAPAYTPPPVPVTRAS